jgi:outer membrane protein
VRHALDLLRKERASSTRILELTRERVGAGFELPIEITRAELTAARVEHRHLQLEGREDVLQAQLRDLCGLTPDRRIELATSELPNLGGLADRPLRELIEMGVQNSIDLRQAELELTARQHRLRGERGGYFPTVDLVGVYSVLSRINNYDEFFKKFQRNNVNIGVQVNIPIFSSRTKAAIELAREDLSAAELDLRLKRSSVENDLRLQARRARELDAGREVARLELKLTQEDLRVLQARFEEGRASLRDLETMRLEESNRWLAFLDADFAQQQARIELLRSTGQLSALLQ